MTLQERKYLVTMWTALQKIAVGRTDCGRPLGGEPIVEGETVVLFDRKAA